MENSEYIGLGKRFVAFFLDYLIIGILALLIMFGTKLFFISSLSNDSYSYFAWGMAFFYFILLESSFLQGTFGKVIGKIKVVNANGERLTVLNATVRFFAKFISALIFGPGFLMIAFTKNKQGLHDKLARTYMVKVESYDELAQGGVNKALFVLLKSLGWVIFALLTLFIIVSLLSSLFSSQAAKDAGNFLALLVGGIIWVTILYGIYKLFFKVTGADEGYLANKMFSNTKADIFGAFTNYDYTVKQKGDFTKSKHRTKEDAVSMTKSAENECYIYYKDTPLGVWNKGQKIRDYI